MARFDAYDRDYAMRVLITYGWGRTGYVVAQALTALVPACEIYVCGSTLLSMTRFSRFVKKFFLTPDPDMEPEKYARKVSDIVNLNGIDVVLPVYEDVFVIQKYRHFFTDNIEILSPGLDRLEIASSKWSIIEIAKNVGVAIPITKAPRDIDEALISAGHIGYPLLLKSRRGNSGKEVFFIKDQYNLRQAWHKIVLDNCLNKNDFPILQQFIFGKVFGSCFLADKGKLIKCFTEEYLHCHNGDFGASTFRVHCNWPLLENYTERLVRALRWTGIGHFDFVGSREKDSAYLIEMNARFWGALKLSLGNGYNFPAALISLLIYKTSPEEFFIPPSKGKGFKPCLWLAGEMMSFVNSFRKQKFSCIFDFLKRLQITGISGLYDDFCWTDPLPFFIEILYFFKEFLRTKFASKPVKREILK
ncbi:MAG: ATP-grasp domain-containing protein [Dehalococcoidales bacterium]|nr:ATP-grasp domain-containing protein [Dehalococcoidales bacterium]